jgi:hypothetical protein
MKKIKYKNRIIELVKVCMEWENKYYWVFLIDGRGGDDLYRTQKDAIYSAKSLINEV